MRKFQFLIKDSFETPLLIEVDANNENEAYAKAREMYGDSLRYELEIISSSETNKE